MSVIFHIRPVSVGLDTPILQLFIYYLNTYYVCYLFVVSDVSRHLSLWSVLKKKPVSRVKRAHGTDPSNDEPNWVSALATLHNTDLVATGSCDGTINLWAADHTKRKLTKVKQIDLSTVLGETNFQKKYFSNCMFSPQVTRNKM